MSPEPTNPKPDIQRLLDDGYEVDLQHGYLLVHSVPYVTSSRDVALGVLVSQYDSEGKPKDHTIWFHGETPCAADGRPLEHLVIESTRQPLFDQFEVTHRFSNKQTDVPDFPADYHIKLVHYIRLLSAHARAIDPNADARTGHVIRSREENPIFVYPDSASARAEIVAIAQKLELSRIAIAGLGGTGGYILDQIAKTRVREIHLFDGKEFGRHNAFRAPGAASVEQLESRPKKVQYFSDVYGAMHHGIVPHPYHVDDSTVTELKGYDFVFVSVDDGLSRALICKHLLDAGIPFVDVGMGLEKGPAMASLLGICRVTLGTPAKHDHLARRLPTADDRAEALYRSNIQVADMNALNANLAVMKWKQHCGFYEDYDRAHHVTFSVAMQSIARAELANPMA
jgi:molybdopterin/thiamine biosynthesis adenylyltransferase